MKRFPHVVESEGQDYERNQRHILPVMEPHLPNPITHANKPNVSQHTPRPQMDKSQMTETLGNTQHTPAGHSSAEEPPSRVLQKRLEFQDKCLVWPTTSMYV